MVMMPETVGLSFKCCTEKNLEYSEAGVAGEWEEWKCAKCLRTYVVPIDIVRHFDDMELIRRKEEQIEN